MGLTFEASQAIRSIYNLDEYKTKNHIELIALNEMLESKYARKFLEILFDLVHAEPQEHIFKSKNGADIVVTEDDYLSMRIRDLGEAIRRMRREHAQAGCRYSDYYRNAFRDEKG